jgi:hypothetical protein
MQMAVDLARFSAHSHQVASLATAGNDRMHQIMAQVREVHCMQQLSCLAKSLFTYMLVFSMLCMC